ncbi:MAG TPA: hypothetical protein DIV82_03800 [Brevundimonas diminuta]|nr:hypothetical protein [Brevundimonas diminuta]
MIEAWRIDSLDMRAGRAFASFRLADLEGDIMPVDADAVFISAPDFAVESLATRAPGLAAARTTGQLGLFVDEREVAFDSLEALKEFVRRAYLAGSGGSEPEDGGPTPEGPLSPGGGEDGRDFEGERDPVIEHLVVAGKHVADRVSALELSDEYEAPSAEFKHRLSEALIARVDAGKSLAEGAVAIAHVLFDVAPLREDGMPTAVWKRAILSLGAAMRSLGVLQDARKVATWGRLEVKAIIFGPIDGNDPPQSDHLTHLLKLGGGSGDYLARRSRDPLDDLEDWPLSASVAKISGLTGPDATVLGLMGAISASPQMLVHADQAAVREAAAIFLFGAAYIVSWTGEHRRGALRSDPGYRRALLAGASNWISEQWPQRLFPGALEDMIRAAGQRGATLATV